MISQPDFSGNQCKFQVEHSGTCAGRAHLGEIFRNCELKIQVKSLSGHSGWAIVLAGIRQDNSGELRLIRTIWDASQLEVLIHLIKSTKKSTPK